MTGGCTRVWIRAPGADDGCLAPLRAGGAAGLERCAYCDADNLTGPDLRLTVDEPARSDVAFEVMLAQVGHEKRRWWAVAITMALLGFSWGVFSVVLWR